MLITGVDIIEINRVELIVNKYGTKFLNRIYTYKELVYCKNRPPQLASRFAAKEAVMKALGTGTRGVGWKDIEISRLRGQAPSIVLHGRAKTRADAIGLTGLALSLSHSKEYAVATCPGTYFGSHGEGYVRLCFATQELNILEGMTRVREFLKNKQKKNQ